jgi:hypothetical protein
MLKRIMNMSLLKSRWFAPALHALLFAITCLTALIQPQPILDGPARWSFMFLFLADLPFSVIGFSEIWDKRLVVGLLLWGTAGTAWWYMLGLWVQHLRSKSIQLRRAKNRIEQ